MQCRRLQYILRICVRNRKFRRKVKFYKHLFLSANSMLYTVFNFAMVHNYSVDDMLRTVFMPQHLAVDLVYRLFEDYVG